MGEALAHSEIIGGAFDDDRDGLDAIRALKGLSLDETQIGVAVNTKSRASGSGGWTDMAVDPHSGQSGLRTVWGFGMLAATESGTPIAVAHGAVAVLSSSAAAVSTEAGIGESLMRLGMEPEDAHYFENEIIAGKMIVAVDAGTMCEAVISVFKRFHASQP
jgi:hypothetical protein